MTHKISPIRAVHSLDTCALFFRLDKKISKTHRDSIAALAMEYMKGKKSLTPDATPSSFAFSFSHDKEMEADWLIHVQDHLLGFVCKQYTRWSDYYLVVESIMHDVFPIMPNHSIVKMGLGIHDIFDVQISGDFPLTELFKQNSPYIAPAFMNAQVPPSKSHCTISSLFDAIHPWALYEKQVVVGAFSSSKNNNLVFRVDNPQSFFANDNGLNLKSNDAFGCIKESADYLHDNNKEILSAILVDTVLERIGLMEGGEK